MLINIEPKHLYYESKCDSLYTDSLSLAIYEKLFCKKRSDLISYITTIVEKGTAIPSVESVTSELRIIFDLDNNDPWEISDYLGVVPDPEEDHKFFFCTLDIEEPVQDIIINSYEYSLSEPYQIQFAGGVISFKKFI